MESKCISDSIIFLERANPCFVNLEYVYSGFNSHVFRANIHGMDVAIKTPINGRANYDKICRYYDLIKQTSYGPQFYQYLNFDGVSVLVEEFVGGLPIHHISKAYCFNNNIYKNLGVSIAKTHSVSRAVKDGEFPIRINYEANKYCNEKMTNVFFGIDLSRRIQNFLQSNIINDEIVVCHGDLHSENIFYRENNFVLIDPDPKVDYSHWDIARLLSSFSRKKNRIKIFSQVIEGYASIRDICPASLSLLYASILIKKVVKKNSYDRNKKNEIIFELNRVLDHGPDYFGR
ncbi:hypothetical protein [Cellvibrio sp. NN19]|uniref:hypothetical protein n=1 Tax=Cellvibrio chitinivorans TaxID=3102792 RepID=UPI002B402716|nr:hypothetical protein [Cellvibrio sp. NN19]